ncbi:ImmA/IrrE family metallo-endopeptidase [Aeriscardovia aeriphila]|uniref:IrrE N-terminal-like domain-containing protein n=1 Tax=Aeriscardovia aeriphila TaxID=218139 RepID=A0A261FA72_9BIFI|nr:ImmA/IrrE family metallo-endopeptidase [Aeriscardovia aeriphila]NYI25819.1 hypothetical protein [Aeriscardovia aeriphila]OZG56032.1 hypothetical protein AEAE_0520 [Aeriscardovia aeriphila]
MSEVERFTLRYCSGIVDDELPAGIEGYYEPADETIHLSNRLNDIQRECVLAHEASHAYHGDKLPSKAQEARADEEAARLLINVDRFAALERVNDNAWWLAQELGVMPWVVSAFRKYLNEVGLLHMEQDWAE